MNVSFNQMNLVLSKKLLLFKCSPGFLVWSIGNTAEGFCQKPIFSRSMSEIEGTIFEKKIISWKWSYVHVESRFYKTSETFLNFTLKLRKKIWKITKFFEKKDMSNCSYGHVESSSDKPANFISLYWQRFLNKCPDLLWKFLIFSKKIVFRQTVPMDT